MVGYWFGWVYYYLVCSIVKDWFNCLCFSFVVGRCWCVVCVDVVNLSRFNCGIM